MKIKQTIQNQTKTYQNSRKHSDQLKFLGYGSPYIDANSILRGKDIRETKILQLNRAESNVYHKYMLRSFFHHKSHALNTNLLNQIINNSISTSISGNSHTNSLPFLFINSKTRVEARIKYSLIRKEMISVRKLCAI